jgi:AcrR family transcriptional regulator
VSTAAEPEPRSARARTRSTVEQRRAEILVATRDVVLRLGFGGTRVKDVADELGVSNGLIHYHFASKDELLAETLQFAAREELRTLEETVATGRRALDRLDRLFRNYLPGIGDVSWRLWIDAWGEALRNETLKGISEELDEAWVALLERIIRTGVRDGEFTCSNPRASAWRIAALMDGLGLQVVLHRSTMSRAQMLEHTRTMAAAELGLTRRAFPAKR